MVNSISGVILYQTFTRFSPDDEPLSVCAVHIR